MFEGLSDTALLRIGKDFEDEYQVSEGLARTVWLIGDFVPPDYATKRWVIWIGRRSTFWHSLIYHCLRPKKKKCW